MIELNQNQTIEISGGLPVAFWAVYVLVGPVFSAGVAAGATGR